jgi:hypothetical protein
MRNTCAYGQAMGEKGVAGAKEGPVLIFFA